MSISENSNAVDENRKNLIQRRNLRRERILKNAEIRLQKLSSGGLLKGDNIIQHNEIETPVITEPDNNEFDILSRGGIENTKLDLDSNLTNEITQESEKYKKNLKFCFEKNTEKTNVLNFNPKEFRIRILLIILISILMQLCIELKLLNTFMEMHCIPFFLFEASLWILGMHIRSILPSSYLNFAVAVLLFCGFPFKKLQDMKIFLMICLQLLRDFSTYVCTAVILHYILNYKTIS